jgi:hypothetical protein
MDVGSDEPVAVFPRSEMRTKDENEMSETATRSDLTAASGQVRSVD